MRPVIKQCKGNKLVNAKKLFADVMHLSRTVNSCLPRTKGPDKTLPSTKPVSNKPETRKDDMTSKDDTSYSPVKG